MEHESFEDEEVARYMNENFINIKIDREERPDIDQIYMDAVQLMNQTGGWPLNCIALPDGKPIWGGTYFQKEVWLKQILNIIEVYKKNKNEVDDFAEKLTEAIQQSGSVLFNTASPQFQIKNLDNIYDAWKVSFDNVDGGANRTPKFPLPNNYTFLIRYAYEKKVIFLMLQIK